ncbi:MAG: hypothetical protein RMI34_09775, partial [Chloroherpetonaceae bacterium]|nr:hypothetical protein [Chloroherpetonaceae bacterium]
DVTTISVSPLASDSSFSEGTPNCITSWTMLLDGAVIDAIVALSLLGRIGWLEEQLCLGYHRKPTYQKNCA